MSAGPILRLIEHTMFRLISYPAERFDRRPPFHFRPAHACQYVTRFHTHPIHLALGHASGKLFLKLLCDVIQRLQLVENVDCPAVRSPSRITSDPMRTPN